MQWQSLPENVVIRRRKEFSEDDDALAQSNFGLFLLTMLGLP